MPGMVRRDDVIQIMVGILGRVAKEKSTTKVQLLSDNKKATYNLSM